MPRFRLHHDDTAWRIYDNETNDIAISSARGVPMDGGGHSERAKAIRQLGYMNAGEDERRKNEVKVNPVG